MSAELKGAKELTAFLRAVPKQVADKAGRQGVSKSASRLRTMIRRAAPRKTGTLRASITSLVARRAPMAWVGLRTRFYYKTLEFGRKAHMRKGKPRKGSPQMSRFAFFKKAISAHGGEIQQMLVDNTRAALFKEAGRLAARLAAPVKVRGGR